MIQSNCETPPKPSICSFSDIWPDTACRLLKTRERVQLSPFTKLSAALTL